MEINLLLIVSLCLLLPSLFQKRKEVIKVIDLIHRLNIFNNALEGQLRIQDRHIEKQDLDLENVRHELAKRCLDNLIPNVSILKTVYLASPYSHKSKKVMLQREKEITKVAAKLLDKHQVSFFLPITQSAPLARYNKRLKGDFETWKEIDLNEIALRDETWVVKMDGWKESIGVQAEIEYAKKLGKTVKFISPKTLRFTNDK